MTDTNTYIRQLKESYPLRDTILRTVIRAMDLPFASRGLDAGCGIGLPALLLAEAVGEAGHIVGMDVSPPFLREAERIVQKANMSERISFREGDIYNLPFDSNTFDWVWSTDCAGYPASPDPVALLEGLARVVKPGGSVTILAWSSQQLLPGHPLLEARMNAVCSTLIPYVKGKRPESNFLRALGWFRSAGFLESKGFTFAGYVQAPLTDDIRTALISFFHMLWEEGKTGMSQEDRGEYDRLCRPESPDFILDLPDYYAFFTYSAFSGKVP